MKTAMDWSYSLLAAIFGYASGRLHDSLVPWPILFGALAAMCVAGLIVNQTPETVRTTPLTERRWEPGGKP